ncbi:hypothetical protein Misp02_35430 [Microtetraspora sp. NBRC 16547]|nr:hypothetical protein Misp02_35430 [Microtetraspora sp. NBRC 16547]
MALAPAHPRGRQLLHRETTSNGTPIEPRNFNRAFEAHCRKAGVPKIRIPHLLLASGRTRLHSRVAMRILRHAQIWMTMDVCTQVASPETRKALGRLNQSLDNPE